MSTSKQFFNVIYLFMLSFNTSSGLQWWKVKHSLKQPFYRVASWL